MTHIDHRYAEALRDAFHYMYRDEVPALKMLVRQLRKPNPVIVNIGAGAGTSGLAILEARPDSYLITIDITAESSPHGCLYGEEQELRKAGLWGLGRNHQIHGDSRFVGHNWEGTVDMVFVDGDHSYEGCCNDIEAWLPKIADGGIIAVHDYKKHLVPITQDGPHPKPWPGVDEAVDVSLLRRFQCILYIDSLIAFRVGDVPVHTIDAQEYPDLPSFNPSY